MGMIENDHQLKITRKLLKDFEDVLRDHDLGICPVGFIMPDMDPLVYKAMRDSVESQCISFQYEIDQYLKTKRKAKGKKDGPLYVTQSRK